MNSSDVSNIIKQVMDFSDHAMYVYAKDDFQILYANQKAIDIFGEHMTEKTCYQQIKGRQLPCVDCPFAGMGNGEECVVERYMDSLDCKIAVRAKEVVWGAGREAMLCKLTNVDAALKEKERRDKEEQKAYFEKLRSMENDTLTGIPNINRFYIDAVGLMTEHRDLTYAIIAFDIDKFKMVNDLFGMATGDAVLRHVAEVLRSRAPEDSLYCRAHSDVFFLCLPYKRKGDVIKLIEKIRKAIYKNGFSFDINTSFGVFLVKDCDTPINLMCDRACLAARTVKDSAVNFCAFYDEQYRDEIVKANEIEQDMNQAIRENQFVMYLQPKVDLTTGKMCGAEVLARWMHPTKGLIQPMDFIPLFERNGFILKLDEYMWNLACYTLAKWREMGKPLVPLSVNISRYHIKHNDLIAVWKRLLKKYDVSPKDLTLEITETFFYDSKELYSVLKELQDMGFSLEVDDFGAGYSSLNLIRNVPIDTIKIDKEFLDKKMSSDKGKIVISHTIAMAKDLELGVIAEGVETKEHVDFLKETNCDIAQGYYFAKPMPLDEFETQFFI